MYSKRGYGDLSLGYNDINKTNVLEYFSDKNTDIKYIITGINFTFNKKSSLKKNVILNNNVMRKIKNKSNNKSNNKSGSKNNLQKNSKSNSKDNRKSTRKSNSKDNRNTTRKKTTSKTNRKSNSKNNSNRRHRSKNKLDMFEALKNGTKKKKSKSSPYSRLYGN